MLPTRPAAAAPPDTTNDFRRVLAGEGISNFGSMLSRLALPWLATLALAATPLQMALLLVADVAAGAAGALLLGTLVDRCPKRTVMIATDIARAALLGGLAALAWANLLSIWLLAAAAALSGALGVAFELARSAWVAQSAAPSDCRRAMPSSRRRAAFPRPWRSRSAAGSTSCSVRCSRSRSMRSATCSRRSASSACAAVAARRDGAPPAATAAPRPRLGFIDETLSGIAVIRATPQLRALATLEILLALAGSLGGTSYMIYVARDLAFPTGTLGMIFATGGLGAIAGAALAPRLARRIGSGNAMTVGLVAAALGTLCIPLAPGATVLGAALLVAHQIVGDGGVTLFEVHDRTLRQTLVAPELLARVDGGLRTLGRLATLDRRARRRRARDRARRPLRDRRDGGAARPGRAVAHHRLRHQR